MGMETTSAISQSSALTHGLPGFLKMAFPHIYGTSGPLLLPVHPSTSQLFVHFNGYVFHEPCASSLQCPP